MKKPNDKCTLAQRVLLIIGTTLLTFLSSVALADEMPTWKKAKHYKHYNTKRQQIQLGVSSSYINFASGHKGGYSANLAVGNQRHLVEMGAILNSETQKADGAHMYYKFFFMPNTRHSSLYMQTSLIYHHQSPLKNKLNQLMHGSEFTGENEKYNSMEAYAGFGFQQRFMQQFFLDFNLGVGAYTRTLNGDDLRNSDYRRFSDDIGYGVNVKFTLGYYLW